MKKKDPKKIISDLLEREKDLHRLLMDAERHKSNYQKALIHILRLVSNPSHLPRTEHPVFRHVYDTVLDSFGPDSPLATKLKAKQEDSETSDV